MDKRLKARWVKALRSGDYKQGRFALAETGPDGTHFCCLGVLREICPTIRRTGGEILSADDSGIPEPLQGRLASYNDSGKSFAWIAANIERRKSL